VPALQTKTSIDPSDSITCSTVAFTEPRSATSQENISAESRPWLNSARVCPSLLSSRPIKASRRPSESRTLAIPRPMPLPAPVTSAVFNVPLNAHLLMLPLPWNFNTESPASYSVPE